MNMASITTEQVIEALFESAEEEVDNDEEGVAEAEEGKLDERLASFPGPEGFNFQLLKKLLPTL